jgi:predicted DNA-binding mobile mystery protein A
LELIEPELPAHVGLRCANPTRRLDFVSGKRRVSRRWFLMKSRPDLRDLKAGARGVDRGAQANVFCHRGDIKQVKSCLIYFFRQDISCFSIFKSNLYPACEMTMKRQFNRLKLEQVDATLRQVRRNTVPPPPKNGWIRTIREGLGMTQAQLAKRLGISRQALDGLERGEVSGTITLDRLKRLAEALHSRLVYMIVPETSLTEMRLSRAVEIAETQLKRVSHSMKLEAQNVKQREVKRQLNRLVDEILSESPRKLWD